MAKYLVQHRRGTAAQWAEKCTTIPREGEIVIEIDEERRLHKLKIGDGVTPYADLKYLMAGDEIVTQVLAEAKPSITGEGAPTSATEAVVGGLYLDTLTSDMYKCTAATDGVYTWVKTLDEKDKAEVFGDIEAALDSIITIQNTLIGGEEK